MALLPRLQISLPVRERAIVDAVEYSPLVVEHFQHPRNTGRLAAGADVIEGAAGSVAKGTRFALSAKIDRDRLADVRFEVYGCPHCIAAGSWLSECLIGATLPQLQAWSWSEAAQHLSIPAEKRGRLLILEDAVRALADAWRRRA